MPRALMHPGEILEDELDAIGLPVRRAAVLEGVPPNRRDQMIAGKRSLTAGTDLRLGRCSGTSPDFCMNLQTADDPDLAQQPSGEMLRRIPRRSAAPPRHVA